MPPEQSNTRVSVTLSAQTLNRLEMLEQQLGWSKSQVVSVALAHYRPPVLSFDGVTANAVTKNETLK